MRISDWSSDVCSSDLQVGVGEALGPGERDGEFEDGRYRWHLRIDPYVDPTARTRDTIEPGAARLMLLALDVEWGDGGPRQSLQLQTRSEEHTSELQSLMRISYAVFCLKKKQTTHHTRIKKHYQ